MHKQWGNSLHGNFPFNKYRKIEKKETNKVKCSGNEMKEIVERHRNEQHTKEKEKASFTDWLTDEPTQFFKCCLCWKLEHHDDEWRLSLRRFFIS